MSSLGPRKRKRTASVVAMDGLLEPSILVRAHPPNALSRPCTLLPLMLLPREHLPLSCLDLSAPRGDLPSSRRFQSHIRILELDGRLGSSILIARLPTSNPGSSSSFSSASNVFAVERDAADLYVLCKLGAWVDLRQLSQNATAVCEQRMPTSPQAAAGATETALVTPQVHKERGKKRLAIAELQSIVRRRPASQRAPETPPTESPPQPDETTSSIPAAAGDGNLTPDSGVADAPNEVVDGASCQTTPGPAVLQSKESSSNSMSLSMEPVPGGSQTVAAEPSKPEPGSSPTADDIFQNIRNQYFEALYHSMGSLAYFAKGPLSRARAAFHLDCDAILEMGDLINFLKSLVLTTAVIDKKFRETVPEIVGHLRTFGNISDHGEPKRRSKKPKKVRLGSNGLYTNEEAHIQKWWEVNKPAPRDDEVLSHPEEVKYALSCLRTRETQLQMILILEILALETMRPPASEAGESQLPDMVSGTPVSVTPAKIEAPKKRNKHNFPLLIDMHVDRLCIWQSTVSDEVRALAESQTRPNSGPSASQPAQSDPLKEFCVDIIVPFFAPRLPLVCDSLNRKLGGPVIKAPGSRLKTASGSAKLPAHTKTRDKSSGSKHSQRATLGSVATKRPSSASSSRNLERVLSNERLRRSVSRGPNDAIAHLRSATAAPIPGLKREMSDPSLASIPRRTSSVSLKERPANALAKSATDVSAGDRGKAEDHRARKKALVEAELQEAISALKKPNRELAGKAAVEAAEKRLFGVPGQSRKPKRPSRPSAPSSVQVKATPVTNRFRDVVCTALNEPQDLFGGDGSGMSHSQPYPEQLVLPTHSEPLFAPRSQPFVAASPRVVSTPIAGRIQATPTRNPSSMPDSAMRATTNVLGGTMASTADAYAFGAARVSTLQPFWEEDDSVPMSSPIAARCATSTSPIRTDRGNMDPASDLGNSRPGLGVFQRLDKSRYMESSGVVLASSPQAPSHRETALAKEDATLFETPTKRRIEKDSPTKGCIMATPIVTNRSPKPAFGGNSIQSLYQQMGWNDEVDDLA